jgi:single-stranded DNA-binding protein
VGDFAGSEFIGHLTRDPGHRKKGVDPVNCAIAVNSGRERVDFFELEAYGSIATLLRDKARKGSYVFVRCRPYVSKWVGRGGEQRREERHVVRELEFLKGQPPVEERPDDSSGLSMEDLLDMVG